MFRRSQRSGSDVIEVIVGPGATLSGNLRCDASIRIDGSIESGQIETPANVIFTETARAECNVIAKNVSIRGRVRGIIRAERVELLSGSQVYGALHVNTFYMDDGVLMRAELNIQGAQDPHAPVIPAQPQGDATIPVIDSSVTAAGDRGIESR
ncbi:MAG: polymer-forming cytoskeletal protein [Caldilineaceae bacterium]|nr:polymer-forming cytoskeletal protein [Caldilineaceae bacterium]